MDPICRTGNGEVSWGPVQGRGELWHGRLLWYKLWLPDHTCLYPGSRPCYSALEVIAECIICPPIQVVDLPFEIILRSCPHSAFNYRGHPEQVCVFVGRDHSICISFAVMNPRHSFFPVMPPACSLVRYSRAMKWYPQWKHFTCPRVVVSRFHPHSGHFTV